MIACPRNALVAALIFCQIVTPAMAQFTSPLPDLGDSSQAAMSPAMERQVGEQVMRDIRFRDKTYVDDPELEDYLNALGARLVIAGGGNPQDFSFFAMRDGSINAFALPGGFIGVHTGLLLAARNESELASVLAHEVAHVRQRHIARMLQQQSDGTMLMLLSLAAALLASRSNSQAPEALIAAGQAATLQQQLGFSRDHEHEADRIGFQMLERAGFDPRGMAGFFEQLQRANRFNEGNVPVYLRTHPLTTDRIADAAARVQESAVKTPNDSLEFMLLRAKYDAERGTPREAMARANAVTGARATDAAVRWYGLARTAIRDRDFAAAQAAVARLRETRLNSPLIEMLDADLHMAQRRPEDAALVCQTARARFARSRALHYCEVNAWLEAGKAREALEAAGGRVVVGLSDYRLYALLARSYQALNDVTMQHRAQAEAYVVQGSLPAAIDQLTLAQKSGGGDYYEQAIIDARLRELKARQREEMNERGKSARNGKDDK